MVKRRMEAAAGATDPGAVDYYPKRNSLSSLRKASLSCRGCDLFQHATQTVFGEGDTRAAVVLVGEQPGNDEDLSGRPFVGPAGRLLDEALRLAGLSRDKAYVTNVGKHFKWEPRGKRRIHSRPRAHEIHACMPWLEQELAQIRPQIVICLGATATQALLGRQFRVTEHHGAPFTSPYAAAVVATIHPSSILRQPTAAGRDNAMKQLVQDLAAAAKLLRHRPT